MYKIIFSPKVPEKLEKLTRDPERKWGIKVKQEFLEKFDQTVLQIAQMPHSFPSLKIKRLVNRCLISKHNALYYFVNDKTKTIELRDTRRKNKHPKKLK